MFIFFLAVALILINFLHNKYKYWTSKNVKLFSIFYYQNFLPTKREHLRQASKSFLLYGSFRFLSKTLTILDIDFLQHIFTSNKDAIGRSFSIYPGSSIMNKILPHLEVENWKRIKKLMIRGFSTKNLKHYQTIVEEMIKSCLNSVIKLFTNLS